MPSLEVTYNRDECTVVIRDYYHFLTKLYLDESEIVEPRGGGLAQHHGRHGPIPLDFVLISSATVHDVYTGSEPGGEGYIVLVQEVYRRHGWPDMGRFRKTEGLEEVRNALGERYPGEFE
ncbi:hypothetical protein FJTKL_01805 [Diaporthe vaccinii]|uniref:Uncharacterized protein n=1 Tax=Diaporthe vaccinii TaxID=105482 RepID=A0ABR4F4V5_9PEZI